MVACHMRKRIPSAACNWLLSLTILCLPASFACQNAKTQQIKSAHDIDERALLRTINFGNREIHLPLQEKNDQLALENALLESHIAKLNDEEQDQTRIQIARYFAAMSKDEVRASNLFAWTWSPAGSEKNRQQLEEGESNFDDASRKCHERNDDGKKVVFTSLLEAQAACSELASIIKQTMVYSLPQGKVPSVFTSDKQAAKRVGHALLIKDQQQMSSDRLRLPKATKKIILNGDLGLIDQDKQVWLTEITEDNVAAFNSKYPEQPMASGKELLAHFLEFRNQLANALSAMRTGS